MIEFTEKEMKLMTAFENARQDVDMCEETPQSLAELTGFSEKQVGGILSSLDKKGVIAIETPEQHGIWGNNNTLISWADDCGYEDYRFSELF